VSIDICEKCVGVWLDSGELEQLTKREAGGSGGFFSNLWGG
jgi:Zn-finger nucleic acid-binding protein